MSEVSTSVSSGSSGSTEIVRGDGAAPGQNPGEPMPAVTTNERKSLSDFKRDMEAKNNAPARAPQPQTAKSRIGAFSEALEKRQQAPVMPGEPREPHAIERAPQEPPEVKQLSDSDQTTLATDDSSPSEIAEEGTPAEAISIDDRAALERYRQWEKDDMFPAELEAKLHEVNPNGVTRYVDTKELKQGYMRGGDYRRAYAEVQQQQQAVARKDQAIQAHFEAIRDPDQMLEIYERNGYGETLMKVAEKLQERQRYRQGIIEGAGIAAMRALGLRQADWNHRDVVSAMQRAEQDLILAHNAGIERRKLDFERAQYEQGRQQAQAQERTQQYAAQYERQLNQLRPNAFRAYGLADTAGNRQALIRHLKYVFATPDGAFKGEITRRHVMAAAESLRDEEDREKLGERKLDVQAMRPAGGQPLPPNRIASGGGAPLGATGGRKQGRLSDLEAEVRARRTQ